MQNEVSLTLLNTKSATTKRNLLLATAVCMPAALFYLYEFVLQVSPSVITTQLMHDLHLNAAGLGAMAAFYYYAYTPMQLPAGLLFDRFGPRILITAAILVCALGALFFGQAHNAALAGAGRFLMGIGSAFSFIGALLLISRWFPPHYFAILAGLVQLMSSIGAIAGEMPLAAAVIDWGWRHTMVYLGIFGILLTAVAWFITQDHPPDSKPSPHEHTHGELARLRSVCGNRETWFAGLYTFSVWAPIVAFAALWGVPFLVAAYGVSTKVASAACSMIWLGIGIGSPLVGWWSDHWIQKRCPPLTFCALLGFVCLSIVLFVPDLSPMFLFGLLFLMGVASAGQSLSFGIVKDNNPPKQVGTAIGFNNMATVAGGIVFQPLIGALLHWHWSGVVRDQVPYYTLADYRIALCVLPLCYLIGAAASGLLLRETHCRHTYH